MIKPAFKVKFKNGKKGEFIMKLNKPKEYNLIYTHLGNITFLKNLSKSLQRSLKFFFKSSGLKSISLPLDISDLIVKFFGDENDELIFIKPKGYIYKVYNNKRNKIEFEYFREKENSKKTTLKFNLKFVNNSIFPLWMGTLPPSMIQRGFKVIECSYKSDNYELKNIKKYIENRVLFDTSMKSSILDWHDDIKTSTYKNILIQLTNKNYSEVIFTKVLKESKNINTNPNVIKVPWRMKAFEESNRSFVTKYDIKTIEFLKNKLKSNNNKFHKKKKGINKIYNSISRNQKLLKEAIQELFHSNLFLKIYPYIIYTIAMAIILKFLLKFIY